MNLRIRGIRRNLIYLNHHSSDIDNWDLCELREHNRQQCGGEQRREGCGDREQEALQWHGGAYGLTWVNNQISDIKLDQRYCFQLNFDIFWTDIIHNKSLVVNLMEHSQWEKGENYVSNHMRMEWDGPSLSLKFVPFFHLLWSFPVIVNMIRRLFLINFYFFHCIFSYFKICVREK